MKNNIKLSKITTIDSSAISPITSITGAVHTALGICYKILRLRETSCQTCEANDKSNTAHMFSWNPILHKI